MHHPFDRSPKNGFRCVFYPDPDKIPEPVFAMTVAVDPIDFYKLEPVSETIFQVYKEQFSYDRTPLRVQIESGDKNSDDWIHERITLDAAYGNERIIAHLFLPKGTPPPYQTVLYVPGSGSVLYPSSEDLANYFEFPIFLSFLIKSGRAVLYPVYKGTFERSENTLVPIYLGANSHAFTEYLIPLLSGCFSRNAG